MLVKLLVAFSGPEVNWPVGSEQDLDQAEALRFIDAGYAVPVSAPKVETASAKPVREKRG